MKLFSFSELWGPFACEVPGCGQSAWTVFLSDEDEAKLPKEEHPSRTVYILEKGVGTMLCDDHLPNIV